MSVEAAGRDPRADASYTRILTLIIRFCVPLCLLLIAIGSRLLSLLLCGSDFVLRVSCALPASY